MTTNMDVIEKELRAIWDERGTLIPGDIVDVAAAPDHPLHRFFTWDDTAAAAKYREVQAAGLIRSVKVRVTQTDGQGDIQDFTVRAWLPARYAGAESSVPAGYMPESDIRGRPEVREALLRQMQRDLNTFRRRYQHLAEYWNAIDDLVAEKAAAS